MADYSELSSYRGRLFYSCNRPLPAHPTGYFRPRVPRPHTLRITQAPAEYFGPKKESRTSKRILRIRRFVRPKDKVQKLQHQVPSPPKPPNLVSSPLDHESASIKRRKRLSGISTNSSGISSLSSLAEMLSLDVNRNDRSRASSRTRVNNLENPIDPATLAQNARAAAATAQANSINNAIRFSDERPVASGNGVAVSLSLAEPVLFLQGFDQTDATNRTTTLLRGSLRLSVTKSAKIKTITLTFKGKATTEWPEGIPPRKVEFQDSESIMNHTWPFFNAQFQTAEYGHGADSMTPLKGFTTSTREVGSGPGVTSAAFDHFSRNSRSTDGRLTPKDAKRLSLAVNHSRSFGKDEHGKGSVASKGYRTFTPGDYIYGFELPIDSRMPETINVELGSVKYELEATVERAGAFRANLVGGREVTMIRAPSENSLETVEPIAISRNWEDQLHYDIVISGKSFPLGAQVPIAFKLTPLAKVQCHRIKVYVTENIHYYTANKRVHRLEPTRKVQLFEKRADGPSQSTYPGSTVRITAGGGIGYDERVAAASGDECIPRDTTNLLGDLESGQNIGPTEMEINVQLPSCWSMQEKEKAQRIHFDTTFSNIQVHHWIKIVLRLSKPDATDPTKRRHFEISIDSPFHILSCRATQAATALPAYSSPDEYDSNTSHPDCGCPGATMRRNTPPWQTPTLSNAATNSSSSSGSSRAPSHGGGSGTRTPTNHNRSASDLPLRTDTFALTGLARPQAAHLHGNVQTGGVSRPMHLLRQASFGPPAFDNEEPPPPLMTPPPQYESIVSGDPRGGLADYFARLAEEEGSEDEAEATRGRYGSVSRGRMEVPLTPGGRVNRSMDERRAWMPPGADR